MHLLWSTIVLIFSDKFPSTTFKKEAARRYSMNTSRTAAYGTPEVMKKIFTGQLPRTYFNDFCYGFKRDTPREFQYSGPTIEREKPLWEPKQLRRTEARHKIRDIQDARFVKSNLKWASSWDYGTYHIGDQRRLRRAFASAQSDQISNI